MYLDFIIDIANKGDLIRVICNDEVIEGVIVKISSSMLAVQKKDGTLVFKKDDEITDVILKPESKSSHEEDNSDSDSAKKEPEQANASHIQTKSNSEIEVAPFLTLGDYNSAWDSINKDDLVRCANRLKHSLTKSSLDTIISSNANVVEVLARSFRVSTEQRNKLSVQVRTIIENKLYRDLADFNIGDSLPVVIYFHEKLELKNAFLTLAPNTIRGYVELLINTITENHYKEAKSLCYFLLSIIHTSAARKNIFALIQMLKPVNAFEKIAIKATVAKKKMPKDYKQIEKQLNQLISKGLHADAISLIDSILQQNDIDEKYRSSLLLRKAQAFSSMTDYVNARLAYQDLIKYKEDTKGEANNLSHLYTELARLQAMDKNMLEEAIKSAKKALSYNPQNNFASTLLEQLSNGTFTSVSVPNTSDSNVGDTNNDEDKELMLDTEDASPVISKMIDIDIREHRFTNEKIINNGGIPTVAIAKSIYEEAKMTKDVDLLERYPVYLEAAKAFSELPVGSYSTQDYIESIAYYAILKGNSLFIQFKKLLSGGNVSINLLTHIKDSACSYYIESLNLLSSIESEFLLTILRNYLKMNIALAYMKEGTEPNMAGQFNKLFFNCVNSNNEGINHIAWATIVAVGTASPKAWNKLTQIKGGTYGLYRLMKNQSKRLSIYQILNTIIIEKLDTNLLPGEFLKKTFEIRNLRSKKLGEITSSILKAEFNIYLSDSINELWGLVPSYSDLFNETEKETKSAIDNILLIIKPYSNRNQVERTNILIQAQREINKQISFINENTTFYGRTFFFPLLNKWKRTIANLLEKKIAETQPQLLVIADPPYIVRNDDKLVINLIVKNVGESTAEGCIMIPTIENLATGISRKGKNEYKNEIPAGANVDVPMNLPSDMFEANSINLRMSISAIYQGKELPAKEFSFTIEREPETALVYEDIPWKDGAIPAERMFKGRHRLLEILKKHYTSIERDKSYILYGLTRTGKSSILRYLGVSLNKSDILVDNETYTIATFNWDLSQAASYGNAQDMWEYLLSEQLNEELYNYMDDDDLNELGISYKPRAKDLNKALRFLKKKKIYPIFLVDEFSYIKVLIDKGTVNPAFLHTLRQYSLEGLASFVYAGTYDIKALLKDTKYGITGQLVNAIEEQVGEIDSKSSEELINVISDKLKFTHEAIAHIHKLSGDVPYFVQMICKYCGFYAVEKKRSIIGYPELERIIRVLSGEEKAEQDSMIKTLPENVFQNNMYSPADPIEVNVLISSIAFINRKNRENPRGVGVVELQELWAKKEIAAYRPMLAESIELLRQKKVLLQQEDEGIPVYKISVDLFRRWWAVHNPDINLQLDKIL